MILTHKEVVERLKAKAPKYGQLKTLAKELGISQTFLSQVFSGVNKPSKKILIPLKLERIGPDCYRTIDETKTLSN